MPEEKLRIAFATSEYVTEKPFDCGLATYLYRVGRELASRGHEVHIVTLSETEQSEFRHDDIIVHRVKVARFWLELNRFTRYRLATGIYLLGLSASVYRRLKRIQSQQPFDLFQFPHHPYCGLVSILFLRVPHVLRASWYEAAWSDSLGIRQSLDGKVLRVLEKLQLRLSSNVCTPSRTLQQILTERAGVNCVRLITSPCYIETTDWDYSSYEALKGKEYLLFFGRFELRKGFHILSQALPDFLARNKNAFAVLIGRDLESSLAPSMAEYARSLLSSHSDRVVILDRLRHAQLYPIIQRARLVVLPSLMDNLPNACLEAMALGKPVIGTRGASFDEMITDGENGFLVTPNEPGQLAEKMNAVWNDPRLEEIGKAAQIRAQDFAPEHTVQELVSYYREILNGNAKDE